jgi:MFS transporter, LPLT family, lysophospholipid transporter
VRLLQRMPPGFRALIGAQFLSALADNALLIVAIAWMLRLEHPAWWVPLLKLCFTLAYVALAPFVGVVADAGPKPRLMMAMNALKVVGVVALWLGLHPLAALAVVGLGAAAYAPAKYGLVTESVLPERLVQANGWIEVTTVCAAVFGVVLGGFLVGEQVHAWTQALWPAAPPLGGAFALLLGTYGAAALLNLGVRDSGVRYARQRWHVVALTRSFWRANTTLWRDAAGGLSLAVTTLFWGAAAVLQFAVLRWAVDVLGLTLERAAYLQALVAVGVVIGAVGAGRWVSLRGAPALLPAGLALGLLVPLVAMAGTVAVAAPLLVAVGLLGGALVVPMNALLQHRGHVLLTAGRSIAVQGFNENASMIAMLALYAVLLWAEWPIRSVLALFGALVAMVVALLMRLWRLQPAVTRSLPGPVVRQPAPP